MNIAATGDLQDPGSGRSLPEPGNWSLPNTPALAAQATITQPLQVGLVPVCNAITATLSCGATPQTPLTVTLYDGATPRWQGTLACPAGDTRSIVIAGMNIRGTSGVAMKLEFSGVGVANSQQSVTLGGYWST